MAILALALSLSAVSNLEAQASAPVEDPASLQAVLSFSSMSDYFFRGKTLYEGLSLQPSVALAYQVDNVGEFSAAVWAHFPGEGQSARKSFTEVDFTLAYNVQTGPFTFSLGHTWFQFYDVGTKYELEPTREVFGGFVFDALLTPSLMVNYDYDNREGQYYDLSFSERLESASFGESVGITPYIAFGMAHRSSQYARGGVVQVTYGLSTDIEFEDLVLSPGVAISLSRDARTRDDVWFGVRTSWQW